MSNLDVVDILSEVRYTYDTLACLSLCAEEKEAFLRNHNCFSDVTIGKDADDYHVKCGINPGEIMHYLDEKNMGVERVEVLNRAFIQITNAIRFVNAHINVVLEHQDNLLEILHYLNESKVLFPLTANYLNVLLMEEKLFQCSNTIVTRLAADNLTRDSDGKLKPEIIKNTIAIKRQYDEYEKVSTLGRKLLKTHRRLKQGRDCSPVEYDTRNLINPDVQFSMYS